MIKGLARSYLVEEQPLLCEEQTEELFLSPVRE